MPDTPILESRFRSATMRFLDDYFPIVLDVVAWIFGGSGYRALARLHRSLSHAERVDFVSYDTGKRGFALVLDQQVALHFSQDGDGFVYDGYDTGDFAKGDVTILDDLPEKKN